MSRTKSKIGIFLMILVLGLASVGIIFNRTLIFDYVRGANYSPSPEMQEIKTHLQLTDQGQRIFNASWPSLENQTSFNTHCVNKENSTAILGCYTEENIYVYRITEPELNGILEATTAHELLHAVFARLSDSDKAELKNDLNSVLVNNSDILSSDLSNYPDSEQFEELYVRAGTEVKNLPASLESHYGSIFQNQDQIVAYYDQYNAVFYELSAKLAELKAEIAALGSEIDQKTLEYETSIGDLNAKIAAFNACASQAGCFTSEADFNHQRWQLLSSQTALSDEYSKINALIDEYNAKIDLYNNNVLRGEKLNNAINSTAEPLTVDN